MNSARAAAVKALCIWLICMIGLEVPVFAGDDIPVEELPAAVTEALNQAVPGIEIEEAKAEEEDEGTIYEVKGTVTSQEVEAKVRETGEILELEIEGEPDDDDGEDDEPDTTTLPQAAQDALANLFPDLAIEEIELEGPEGHVFYEIEGTIDGSEVELKITPEGTILEFETDDSAFETEGDDTDLAPDDLPSAVSDTLNAFAPGIEFREIEAYGIEGSRLFEIEGCSDGGFVELLIHESGRLIEFERDSDKDGIDDADEMDDGTDPQDRDSDGDAYPDGFELDHESDPLDENSFPRIFELIRNTGNSSLVIELITFEGSHFRIDQCVDPAIGWRPFGGSIVGDGETHTFALPLSSSHRACIFRASVLTDETTTGSTGTGTNTSGETTTCDMPENLEGMEITITDDDASETKTLCFKTKTRGELVETENDDEIEFTPFAYTYKKLGNCKARVTLTFTTSDGFETTKLTLNFSDDGSGAYVSQEYEDGEPEDPESGGFTVSMNGGE